MLNRILVLGAAAMGCAMLNGCTPVGLAGAAAVVALTPGSTHTLQAHEPYPDMGNSIANNNAVHIIDPAPAMAQNTDLPMDGDRALLAIDRYKTGKVIEPEDLDTTTVR